MDAGTSGNKSSDEQCSVEKEEVFLGFQAEQNRQVPRSENQSLKQPKPGVRETQTESQTQTISE